MMRACANLSFLFKEAGSLPLRYEAAANAGFKYVECDFPSGVSPQQLKQAVKSTNLQQILINCFHGDEGEMGFGATPGQESKFENALERTLEFTKATNCKKIHILSGKSFGPEQLTKQIETLERNLKWAAERLRQEGVIGLIEPINPFSKPGYFLNSYDIAIKVIDSVNSPFIRLQLDLFHMQMIAGNITNNIKRFLPYTGHIQVAQSPTRHEPTYEGEVNFQYVFSLLQESGYDGFIGGEYTPSSTSTESLNWVDKSKFGISF